MQLPSDVSKVVLAQGRLEPKDPVPPYADGTKVEFHFMTCIQRRSGEEGPLLDDTRAMGQPMTMILGKQFKMPVWEIMLNTMIPGQVAKFSVPRKYVGSYPMVSKALRDSLSGEKKHTAHQCCGGMMSQGLGFADLDILMKTPKNLSFTFEMITVSPPGAYEREAWQLTESEKLASIPALQAEGNTLFSKGAFKPAEQKYFDAIARLEQLLLKEHPTSSEARVLEGYKVPLLLNYALCLMKRDETYEAITHLDSALKLQPENVKGLFRRGQCHQAVGDYREARSDFNKAAKLDPSLQATVATLEGQMMAEQKRRDDADKDNFKRIFRDGLMQQQYQGNTN